MKLTCLEKKAVIELWVGPRSPGLRLAGPPIVREKPELHQRYVAVEMRGEVAKTEQGDHDLFAAVSILYREAEARGQAWRGGHHLIQWRCRVEAGQHRPHWVPT